MLNYGIIGLMLSVACYGIVMWIQICRIDRLESQLAFTRHKYDFWIRAIREEIGHQEIIPREKRLPADPEFSLGDAHPFAPDAFVTTTDRF